MKILSAVALFLLCLMASSQVIGIDFGTEFWKASLISPGKNLVIVENIRSGRKSHNGIAFLEGVRHFEYDALMKRLKKPKVSYFFLNKLIESLDHQHPVEGFHFQNGTYHFKEGDDTLTLEHMIGMILKNVKTYSSQQAGSDIKDSVLTVPAHWGFKAKFSLINAASIADLSVLGLVNENSAAAIHFAITRNDSDPVNIGFFNLGSHNLQISIVQFFGTHDSVRDKNIESMRVLSHVSTSNIGGLKIDQLLAEHIASQFKAKHKIDIHSNLKSWTKLLHKSSDLKETLSANKEANIYIEGLIDGIDLNMKIKRQILHKSPVFDKIGTYLQQTLDKAGIKKQDLDSVEVIGGASRIPQINIILKEFFDPVEVGSHINGDQSMAFGAALRAANLSIAFRVKQLHFYDGNPEPVRAVITNAEDGVLDDVALFDKDSEQGLRKEVVIDQNQNDVKVAVYYGEQIVHQYFLANVSLWKQKYNQSALNFTQEPKLILVFKAHSFNFAQLKQAYINITINTTTTKEVYELVVENVTIKEKQTNQTQQNATEGQEQNKESDEKQSESQEQSEETEEKKEQSDDTKTDEESSQTEKKKTKKKVRERTTNVKKIVQDFKIDHKKSAIKINHQSSKYHRLTKQQIEGFKSIIVKYQKHERYLQQKSKIRNDFESTLYSLKDDFQNPALKTFSTEEQFQKLKDQVAQQLIWLDDNAWTAQKDQFQDHFRIIKNVYLPIVNRSNEYRDRQKYYNKTIQIMSLVYQKTSELNNSHPWLQEKAQGHLKKINDTLEEIHGKIKEQVNRKMNQNVVFYNHQMIEMAEDLRDSYYLIKMLPRPKVVKKVETQTPKEPQADQNLDLGDQDGPQDGQKPKDESNQGSQNEGGEEKKTEDL